MTPSEKVIAGLPITRDEFQELVRKTDWSDYSRRVIQRLAPIVDAHERAKARSMSAASHHYMR